MVQHLLLCSVERHAFPRRLIAVIISALVFPHIQLEQAHGVGVVEGFTTIAPINSVHSSRWKGAMKYKKEASSPVTTELASLRQTGNDGKDEESLLMQQLRSEFYSQVLQPYEGRKYTSFILDAMARRKYYEPLVSDKLYLGREILHTENMTKEKFLKALCLLEFKAQQATNTKKDEDGAELLPPEATVFYISANSLDETKAYFMHFEAMFQQVKLMGMAGISGDTETVGPTPVISEYISCLRKSPHRDYVKLDVDTKDKELLAKLKDMFQEHNVNVHYAVETRGGYHLLLPCGQDLTKLYALANKLTRELGEQHTWLTIEGPTQSPLFAVPGTYQSDWLVRPAVEEFVLD